MAEIVNLNRARKARMRHVAEKEAEANRIRFGRSRAERAAARDAVSEAERGLDGHRLTPADDREG